VGNGLELVGHGLPNPQCGPDHLVENSESLRDLAFKVSALPEPPEARLNLAVKPYETVRFHVGLQDARTKCVLEVQALFSGS